MKYLKVGFISLFVLHIQLGHAIQNDDTLVKVNGGKVTQRDLDEAVSYAIHNGAKDTPELHKKTMSDLVVFQAILQDTKKTKLANKDTNATRIKFAKRQVLKDLWFEDYLSTHPITDTDLRSEYDRLLKESKEGRNANEYRFSQIVVNNESLANDILNQLNAGANFEKLAQEKSIDSATATKGGLVPNWVLPDMLLPSMGDYLVNSTPGKVEVKVVKSSYGWHIMRVNEVRKFNLPSYENEKLAIYQKLLERKKEDAIDNLLKVSKVSTFKER
jgi:peptidyl-prolyl cis-trans isomerase C